MSDSSALWQQWEGHIVPREFLVEFVVLSYIVSYIGTWTTLEIFNQMTAGRGLYNWSLLLGSSVSMGGIAIWCMHYIGNRAIVLGGGPAVLQISYSPGFTALSFFVPIIVLLVAFTAMGSHNRVSIFRVAVGGCLAGLAICGMHYLGQTGISNYTCVYEVKNVVGSAVIAVAASVVALSMFFILRATWTNSWWKRASCAIILAGAVSGMHWLASVGTQYRLRQVPLPSSHGNISRNATIIVVIVLSIVACFILLVFTMLAQRRRSRFANRAQQVVLACAIFDEDGRIMVTPEGSLPNRKVTTSNMERSLDGIFGTSHAVFHWIFRATRNWGSVSGLLPSMRKHVSHSPEYHVPGTESTSEVNLKENESEAIEDYSVVFRERFCVAAAELTEELTEPLEKAGILFDEIFNTGQTSSSNSRAPWNRFKDALQMEKGNVVIHTPGRGLLLFLVRLADKRNAEKLSAIGYRFADIQNVANIIARRMQINCNDMRSRLTNMFEYASDAHILKPGVHLACFAIRASVGGGFDVLVCKDARNKLPTVQLPFGAMEDWKIHFLTQLDNKTVTACVKFLGEKSSSTEEELALAAQLIEGITAMREEINHPLFADALLIAKPIAVPCSNTGTSGKPSKAILIAFRLLLPIQFRASGRGFEFIPLNFFKLQQYEYRDGVDGALFARMVHREFGPVLNKGRSSIDTSAQKSPRSPTFLGKAFDGFKSKRTLNSRTSFDVAGPAGRINSDSSSERKLVETQTFGGIMVSQEVSVDIKEYEYRSTGSDSNDRLDGDGVEMLEMQYVEMGTSGRATKEVEHPETYVDILFARCIENR